MPRRKSQAVARLSNPRSSKPLKASKALGSAPSIPELRRTPQISHGDKSQYLFSSTGRRRMVVYQVAQLTDFQGEDIRISAALFNQAQLMVQSVLLKVVQLAHGWETLENRKRLSGKTVKQAFFDWCACKGGMWTAVWDTFLDMESERREQGWDAADTAVLEEYQQTPEGRAQTERRAAAVQKAQATRRAKLAL